MDRTGLPTKVTPMPFTPFHFGVGLAAKAAVPRHFSLAFFVALQVVTDLESLYNLVLHRHPVHRFLHTFVGATLLAAVSSAAVLPFARWWRLQVGRTGPGDRGSARLFASVLPTALFATWSHVVLDGIMHGDVRPFWPLTDANPLLSLIGLRALHLGCMLLGFFGIVALAGRWALNGHGAYGESAADR
jgi:hypothetical protein